VKELNCPCVCARACALVYFRGLFVLHVNPYFPVNVEVFKVAEELKHTRYSWKGIRSCVCFNRKASRLFPSRPPDNLLGRRVDIFFVKFTVEKKDVFAVLHVTM
jgi:hypothetical protein